MPTLRILHIEDDPQDAERVQNALANAGYICETTHVSTMPALCSALQSEFDVILSGYSTSQADQNLNGLTSLALSRERQTQTPFLFVSNAQGDETLINAIRAGAYDFISKRRLVRLAPAIERARREAQEQLELQKAQDAQKLLADGLSAVLSAADELVSCPDINIMLRRAVELAREKLGIERCGLFLLDAAGEYVRGTYGTDFQKQTSDESNIFYPLGGWWKKCFDAHSHNTQRWFVSENEPHSAYTQGKHNLGEHGWIAATPLVASSQIIGVVFNDAAVSGVALDETQQELLAVYCSFLANLIFARRAASELQSVLARARCILFDALIEEQPDGNFKWFIRFTDDTAAQRVLPLDVPPGMDYFQAWINSRHPEDQQRISETVPERAAIDAGLTSYHQEYRCVDKFGHWHWLFEEVTLEPLVALSPDRRRFHATGVCTDITSRRRAEEQLRRNAFYDPLTGLGESLAVS